MLQSKRPDLDLLWKRPGHKCLCFAKIAAKQTNPPEWESYNTINILKRDTAVAPTYTSLN